MLQAHRLSITAGRTALLRDVSASFTPGRLTAIVGPNGAGKSTLLKALAGLQREAGEAVLLDGTALCQLGPRERARRIGYLPQQAELHWKIPVHALVGLGRFPHGDMHSPAGQARVMAALESLDLLHLAQRPALSLSGGERARVMLARVLAGDPEWVLADEPLASLDIAHQYEVLDQFRAMAARGIGVVLVAHDLGHVAALADDAVVLNQGSLVAAGAAAQVLVPDVLAPVFRTPFFHASTPQGTRLLTSGRPQPSPADG